ncbi:MAG: B12-binding domain-containing protein [Candidatus Nanopelagicales bacterium]
MADAWAAPADEDDYHLGRYLDAIRGGDRRAAVDVALELLDLGATAEDVVTHLLARAQSQVGRGWEQGRWSIALEHRATAITESALEATVAAARTLPGAVPEGARGRATVLCSEGEWHSLPGRMMADVLRLRGIDVEFVGPSLPAHELTAYLGPDPPPVVAVSCSLSQSLVGAWHAITTLRRIGTTVVVGGRGFGPHGRWATPVGADQWAPTFSHGADLVMRSLREPPAPSRDTPRDEDRTAEVRFLERFGESMVERAVAEAVAAWPQVMARDAALRATREDLRATLRTVTAAVLVDDDTVVLEFTGWCERVLGARGLPLAFVPSAYELLLHQLPTEVGRGRAMAEAGRAACSDEPLPRS